jgi:predicted enzyme related to lactoylglutathione lyase
VSADVTEFPRTEQLIVEVFVRDIARSKEFYQGIGFAVAEDRGGFVILNWEGLSLFLDEKPNLPPATTTRVNVRIMVADVDEYWRRAQTLGAPVFAPIGNREYGLRDFIILDPDGFGLRFAAPIRR